MRRESGVVFCSHCQHFRPAASWAEHGRIPEKCVSPGNYQTTTATYRDPAITAAGRLTPAELNCDNACVLFEADRRHRKLYAKR